MIAVGLTIIFFFSKYVGLRFKPYSIQFWKKLVDAVMNSPVKVKLLMIPVLLGTLLGFVYAGIKLAFKIYQTIKNLIRRGN